MTVPAELSRRHTYHILQVVDVIEETEEARSLVLDPGRARAQFQYRAGQFLTVRLRLGFDRYIRCYSLSSCPVADDLLKITVKKVPDGKVSNFLNTMMKPGYQVESMPPSGDFVLDDDDDRDIIALASGSGITPVISIIKTAMVATDRRVRLHFANQSRDSIIFDGELAELVRLHPDRLDVVHHIYDERGYLSVDDVLGVLDDRTDVAVYVCGSRHFMDTADRALDRSGISPADVVRERFALDASLDTAGGELGPEVAAERAELVAASRTESVTVRIRRADHGVAYQEGSSLLDTARQASLTPPFACGSGICGACLAKVTSGEVRMPGSPAAIEPDEVRSGWVLTCQAIPMSPSVAIEYPD